ncbi:4-amino-4-deoxy-L-arabinose transferase-like glycosyltransferase [Luteibacter sp. 1214]|uniref:ArnT family glycosyltransferase n=1 Tax=Luteibacter sp. 1214 TaxID=2817735 RepID=UPI002858672F|nr:hypothetical protein [Luteibacter sp. 1214]MDR6644517.1 4-amino-4-deoxy-L-arabinose transferase-like glycosyltransferase [Luteibacter sp. 1214]
MASTTRRGTGWIIAIATLAAFALRYWFFRTAYVVRPVRGDALDYVSYAVNLVQHHVFSLASGSAPRVPDSYRDPGYPLFLVPWIAAIQDAGLRYWALQCAQAALGALTVTLYLLLARHWFRKGTLIALASLLAIWPHSITISAYLVSETLLGFLVAAGLAWTAEGWARQRTRDLVGGALLFGCAGLTNSVVAPFLPLVAAIGWLTLRQYRKQFGIIFIAAALLPACWTIRNLTTVEGPSSNSRAMINLVQGSWPDYHSAWLASSAGDAGGVRTIKSIDAEIAVAVHDHKAGLQEIETRIREHPLHYLAWYASKPALLWDWSLRIAAGHIYVFPTINSPLQNNGLAWHVTQVLATLNPWLGLAMLVGCLLALIEKETHGAKLTASLLMYITVIYGIFQSEPRYAVPFRGAEIAMAVFACTRLIDACKHIYSTRRAVRVEFGDSRHNAEAPKARGLWLVRNVLRLRDIQPRIQPCAPRISEKASPSSS